MIKYDLIYPFSSTIFTSVVILFLPDVNGTPTPSRLICYDLASS